MKFQRFKYDLIQGFEYNRKMIPLLLITDILAVIAFLTIIQSYIRRGWYSPSDIHFVDVLLYFFHGEVAFHPEAGEKYVIPALWMLLQTEIHFLLASYPMRDLKNYGQQVFIRSTRKEYWWYAKCVWNFATVLMFYLILFVVVCAVCYFNNFSGKIECNFPLINNLYQLDNIPEGLTSLKLILQLMVFPVIVSAALGIVQMALSILFGAAASFLIVMFYLYMATFFTKWYYLGTYSIALKSSWFIARKEDSVYSWNAIWLSLIIAVAGFLLGRWAIRRKELY